MKSIHLETQTILDTLFEYPMVDPNTDYLSGKTIAVITDDNDKWSPCLESIITKGANLIFSTEEGYDSTLYGGIIFPPTISDKSNPTDAYYKILEHYIFNAQSLIKSMKRDKKSFKHILFVLPAHSDEYSTELDKMAYYAVYGLVKGLGEIYGPQAVFVNGLMLDETVNNELVSEWASFLISTNANNIIGEIIKL